MSPTELNALANRIRLEFMEMPGMRLTVAQAIRLWGLERRVCEDVIDLLVRSAFLRWTPAGMIVRVG